MADFAPKPTRTTSGTLAPAFVIANVSGSVTSFTAKAFDPATSLVALEVHGATSFVTFDGTAPSSATSNYHQIFLNQAYHWNVATAQAAKFLSSGANGFVIASQFTVLEGDTQLTDTSILKAVPI